MFDIRLKVCGLELKNIGQHMKLSVLLAFGKEQVKRQADHWTETMKEVINGNLNIT